MDQIVSRGVSKEIVKDGSSGKKKEEGIDMSKSPIPYLSRVNDRYEYASKERKKIFSEPRKD